MRKSSNFVGRLSGATVVSAALFTTMGTASTASAVLVGVNPASNWIGFMNVSDLPADGGAYKFGSSWGTADLNATFSGPVLTLTPNTSIARDVAKTDAYWWKADGSPNKNMDASMYVESDALAGSPVTFTGNVLSNTLVNPYTSVAFIKDFVPDFSSSVSTTVPLVNGVFTISLPTTTAGDHIQYGFETVGPQSATVAGVGALGNVQVTASPVPEPASIALIGALAIPALARRRRGA